MAETLVWPRRWCGRDAGVAETLVWPRRWCGRDAGVAETLSHVERAFVELRQSMQSIASMLFQTAGHPDKSVRCIVEAAAISLPPAKAMPVAWILHEHCLHHACERLTTGLVRVGAICSGKELQIVVKDNGQGWDRVTSEDSLGSWIIETLVTGDLTGRSNYAVDRGPRGIVCFPFTSSAAN
ncbi:hypothetical protein [Alicyclobacillus sp. ALC3]|uniref:hypothetical protein n=1 Tax=Alicyclobacillus sp. ALC3 TaxID=2796143 RepID=UPI00237A068B|nr:hypothetical protein [Alicyclobacillus sp. ALC3]WDL97529.1 hypothetical protein JC200_02020 [Alicyclobacillus sp. ALC3]